MMIHKIVKIMLIICIPVMLIAGSIIIYYEEYANHICYRPSGGQWEVMTKYSKCIKENQKKLEKPNYIRNEIAPIFMDVSVILSVISFAIVMFTIRKQKMKDISLLALANMILNICMCCYLLPSLYG